jgi:hypothetical protein
MGQEVRDYLGKSTYYNSELEFWMPNVEIANLLVLTKAFVSSVPFTPRCQEGRISEALEINVRRPALYKLQLHPSSPVNLPNAGRKYTATKAMKEM